jgi:prephenate dehydrogenase
MRIALLGAGLVGGSVARALRSGPGLATDDRLTIVAWTPRGAGPQAAVRAGVVDRAARHPADAIDGADLVVLAGPPLACLDLIVELAGPARGALDEHALVTDVASTKARIVERATDLGLPFVGGHPMAGLEASGFAAARDDLFAGRPWIVVPGPSSPTGGVERVVALALACGARPVTMSAADHDQAVAAISHLPLVVAVALVEAVAGGAGEPAPPDWPAAAALAASGWASMTRLARGDVAMAAGIATTNGPAIAERLRDLRQVIDRWLEALDRADPDADRLAEWFGAARARLDADAPDGGA